MRDVAASQQRAVASMKQHSLTIILTLLTAALMTGNNSHKLTFMIKHGKHDEQISSEDAEQDEDKCAVCTRLDGNGLSWDCLDRESDQPPVWPPRWDDSPTIPHLSLPARRRPVRCRV